MSPSINHAHYVENNVRGTNMANPARGLQRSIVVHDHCDWTELAVRRSPDSTPIRRSRRPDCTQVTK
jgi:hypothetical protein